MRKEDEYKVLSSLRVLEYRNFAASSKEIIQHFMFKNRFLTFKCFLAHLIFSPCWNKATRGCLARRFAVLKITFIRRNENKW